ncbi:MAG: caspase family protein [Gemmatimonadaceae bacterium]
MRITSLLALLALLPCPIAGQPGAPFRLPGKTSALLIGTDNYSAAREWPRLSSPVLDATTIAKSLAGDFAFDTTVVRNASKDDIIRAIVSQGKRAEGAEDWNLVFIAAHGFFDDERSQGYLVFRDSKPRSDDVSRSSYLSLTELRAIVEGFKAGHVLLVIDACYAGTIDPDIRFGTDRAERAAGASRAAMESSLLRRSQYRSRLYLTSGGKEYVPDGRPGAHSPFAGALLGALRKANIEGQALTFSQIVGRMAESAIEPLPRHNTFRGHEPGGDFILLPRTFGASATTGGDRRTPGVEVPARGGSSSERSAGNSTPAPLAGNLSLLVTVDATTEPRLTRDVSAVSETVLLQVQNAFAQRGVTRVRKALGGQSGAAIHDSICSTGRDTRPACVEITVHISQTVANNLQTVTATLGAKWLRSQQFIASRPGKAGPFNLSVPADRVIERAVGAALAEFVDAVLAGARAGQ